MNEVRRRSNTEIVFGENFCSDFGVRSEGFGEVGAGGGSVGVSPFQGSKFLGCFYLGRCPRLMGCCPVGAEGLLGMC